MYNRYYNDDYEIAARCVLGSIVKAAAAKKEAEEIAEAAEQLAPGIMDAITKQAAAAQQEALTKQAADSGPVTNALNKALEYVSPKEEAAMKWLNSDARSAAGRFTNNPAQMKGLAGLLGKLTTGAGGVGTGAGVGSGIGALMASDGNEAAGAIGGGTGGALGSLLSLLRQGKDIKNKRLLSRSLLGLAGLTGGSVAGGAIGNALGGGEDSVAQKASDLVDAAKNNLA